MAETRIQSPSAESVTPSQPRVSGAGSGQRPTGPPQAAAPGGLRPGSAAPDAAAGPGLCSRRPHRRAPEAAMSLSFLGPLHPLIVHTPIVMLIFSAFFAVVGRLFDRDWLKKTSALLLVFGFLGAFLAVQSGNVAHRVPEHQQGVPEKAIDEHGGGGVWVMYLSGGALVVLGIAARL